MIRYLLLFIIATTALAEEPRTADSPPCPDEPYHLDYAELGLEDPNIVEISDAEIRGFKTIVDNLLTKDCPINTISGIIENREELKGRWDYIKQQLDATEN